MENFVVIFSLALISFCFGGNKVINLIIASCLASQVAYMVDMDIALYYSIQGLISIATAHIALRIWTFESNVVATLMLMQFLICFSLVPDWGYSINNVLQFKLQDFNDMMMIILIVIGAASSGEFNGRSDNNS